MMIMIIIIITKQNLSILMITSMICYFIITNHFNSDKIIVDWSININFELNRSNIIDRLVEFPI